MTRVSGFKHNCLLELLARAATFSGGWGWFMNHHKATKRIKNKKNIQQLKKEIPISLLDMLTQTSSLCNKTLPLNNKYSTELHTHEFNSSNIVSY